MTELDGQRARIEMDYGVLGEDLLVEILSRLPKKCLFKFRCVSKGWCRLLSDRSRASLKTTDTGILCNIQGANPYFRTSGYPDFRTSRFFCKPSRLTFLRIIDNDGGAASIVQSLTFPLKNHCRVVDSCNGLLLLEERHFVSSTRVLTSGYVVLNPSTKLSVDVPLPTKLSLDVVPLPSGHSTRVGFAFDGRHYHVICLSNIYKAEKIFNAETFEFDIFSSQTGEWREKKLTYRHPREIYHASPSYHLNQSLFLKGALHWLLQLHLLIYHIEGECIELIKLPCQDYRFSECTWSSEGCLNYCEAYGNRIQIWVLRREVRDDNRRRHDFQWQLKHSVVLPFPEPVSPQSFIPCAFNDDFEIVYLLYGGRMFSCKLETGVLKEVCVNPVESSSDVIISPAFSGNVIISAVYPFLYSPIDLP